jgi:ROK family
LLQPQLDIPVFVENDANGAALAELSFGRRVGHSDICLLFLEVDELVTHEFPLKDYQKALELAWSRQGIKTIIIPPEN